MAVNNTSWVRIVLLVLAGFVILLVLLYRMRAPQAHKDSSVHITTPRPPVPVNLLDLLEGEEIPQEATQKKPQVSTQYKDIQVDQEVNKYYFRYYFLYNWSIILL